MSKLAVYVIGVSAWVLVVIPFLVIDILYSPLRTWGVIKRQIRAEQQEDEIRYLISEIKAQNAKRQQTKTAGVEFN